MEVASNATADVGLELFRHLSDGRITERTENIFISAYGILSALSMLLLGVKDRSEEELLTLMKIKQDGLKVYHESMSRLLATLSSPSLSSANRLFVQQNFSLVHSFIADAEKFYSSGAEYADFADSPLVAQAKINEWVKEKTGGKIADLLNEPLDQATLVFLVNAVYFKADWLFPFQPEDTYRGTFHVSASESIECDMMMLRTTDSIRHGNSDTLDCQLVELPYQGDFSMLIILPYVAENMRQVERKLTSQLLRREMRDLESSPGMGPNIYLPKFKIEFEADLGATLKALGVSSLFDEQVANLTGMIDASAGPVAVSKVIHKAVIEVDEKGTEAAAATGFGVSFMCMPPQYRMDHPFLFALVHRPTGTPVFIGRLSKPPPATRE